ncbi:YifB family Mg chelatase-like AAA ATPase [Nocardioides coralli]|uniref:YifB family Mg chelatase-like AAA ATPase n=1 Tax=Nocardioides coralli TaxID=2872154 RepID=UPI001CA3B899|nr:YifB family Mg chelatase-like AAA ATPase [Nocardioides coralli]QZY28119.1 YifB family Mg chelatase-like AAA ATPase [Nocardioides coralli]
MPVASTPTIALDGAVGHLVDVQADVSPGQAGLTMVGRCDVSLNQAHHRCQMAVHNTGLPWPTSKRVTILLSPADLPKRGTHFDLAIALAVLKADRLIPEVDVNGSVFVGELTLNGGLRAVPGVLPMTLAASRRGIRRVFVPEPQAHEAAMVPDVEVLGVRSLGQVLAQLTGSEVPEAPPVAPMSAERLLSWRGQGRLDEVDMADVLGMPDARYAVEVAAAGGHHLLLSGPKGCGKTTLAERLPTILPDLTLEESIEVTALHSLAGALEEGDGLITRPPFAGPHHDASKASIVGGGSGRVRPGEISRAHCGVLLLDEFPLLRTDVIDALRQPLESGEVTIARGDDTVTYPARGLVVFAANPCPCGDYRPTAGGNRCTCREVQRQDYRRRVRGPITDRIDITRHLEPLQPHDARDRFAAPESSSTVRARVTTARTRQAERFAGRGWRLNGQTPGPALTKEWPLTAEAQAVIDDQMYRGLLSRRGATRVHRMAWTVADLRGAPTPSVADARTALLLRTGEPLGSETLRRVAS